MTIIQLEYLLAIVNCGSFSQASERCFVTQPSLSMQIKNLEEELGVMLLDRTKKPIVPTQAGEIVVERAREALLAYDRIKESVAELQGSVDGHLRLGVIPTIAPYLLPRFLSTFAEKYPKVELEIKELTTPQIIEAMRHDEIDAALLAGGTCPEDITEQELFSDRFYVYASPLHPLYERSNVRIEDIDQHDLLLLSDGHCLKDQILELCGTTRRQAPYFFESGSLETLMRVVDISPAITIVPEMAVEYIPAERRDRIKTLAKGATSRKIAIAIRRTYAKSSIINALREVILSTAPAVNAL
ncbi:MAG: hydrogen peroxide-inducible genes activator [Tidjanibacter sp.]|nr:hydrogen peroxide-inducible genes activator [Tidjanibacter sp.]